MTHVCSCDEFTGGAHDIVGLLTPHMPENQFPKLWVRHDPGRSCPPTAFCSPPPRNTLHCVRAKSDARMPRSPEAQHFLPPTSLPPPSTWEGRRRSLRQHLDRSSTRPLLRARPGNFCFFLLLPPQIPVFSSLEVFSLYLGGVFEGQSPPKCTFWTFTR